MLSNAIQEVHLVKVLFVCSGNICRSPTAEAVFRKVVEDSDSNLRIQIDSAGTGTWHAGEAPDLRSQEVANTRGFDLSNLKSRQITVKDFYKFDYVVVMDISNLKNLQQMCPEELQYKISLFMDYAPEFEQKEVPDPYYGGQEGFSLVLDLIEGAADGLLSHICTRER